MSFENCFSICVGTVGLVASAKLESDIVFGPYYQSPNH